MANQKFPNRKYIEETISDKKVLHIKARMFTTLKRLKNEYNFTFPNEDLQALLDSIPLRHKKSRKMISILMRQAHKEIKYLNHVTKNLKL